MSKILKNITWEINSNGDIVLIENKSNDTDHLLRVWSGSVRENITLKTLAKQVLGGNNVTLMITRGGKSPEHEDASCSYEFGPIFDVKKQLVWQGLITEPEV
jgi:hypothetical protein